MGSRIGVNYYPYCDPSSNKDKERTHAMVNGVRLKVFNSLYKLYFISFMVPLNIKFTNSNYKNK